MINLANMGVTFDEVQVLLAAVHVARTVFPVVNKCADDGMSITWQVTVS